MTRRGLYFALGSRLRGAILLLQKEQENEEGLIPLEDLLMEGVELLEQLPSVKLERPGVGENQEFLHFPDLTEDELARIDAIAQVNGAKRGGRSPVARAAVEALIKQYNLKEFKKPKGWQEVPSGVREPGKGDRLVLPEAGLTLSASIPMEIWQKVSHLSHGRGHAHDTDMDISRLTRLALDEANRDTLAEFLPPLPPRQSWLRTQFPARPILIFARQKQTLKGLQDLLSEEIGQPVSQSLTIAALLNQAIETGIGGQRKRLVKISKKAKTIWDSFIETGSIHQTAKELNIPAQDAADELMAAELIQSYRLDQPVSETDGRRKNAGKVKVPPAQYLDFAQSLPSGSKAEITAQTATHFGVGRSTAARYLKPFFKASSKPKEVKTIRGKKALAAKK